MLFHKVDTAGLDNSGYLSRYLYIDLDNNQE